MSTIKTQKKLNLSLEWYPIYTCFIKSPYYSRSFSTRIFHLIMS